MTALLLSCALIERVALQQSDANQWVVHTFEVRLSLDDFKHQFSAAEISLRSYLDSGNSNLRSVAENAVLQSRQTLSKIKKLTSDNPTQQRRIAEAEALFGTYLPLMNRPTQGPVTVSQEESISQRMQGTIEAMDKEEVRLLGLRTSRTAKLQQVLSLTIDGTLLLGVFGTLFGTSLLSRNISQRISNLLESSILVADGLSVKSLDPSRDELGRLASMLAQTSRVLSENASEIAKINWKLESVLRAATSVSIIAEDLSGRISLFNTGAAILLGYRPDEAIGRSLKQILQEGSSNCNQGVPKQAAAARGGSRNGTENYETTYVRKNGICLHVQVAITLLKDRNGSLVGRLHVAQDITPRKLLETELRNKVEELRHWKHSSTSRDEPQTEGLPEWLNSPRVTDAERLSSSVDALNDWYEAKGHIPKATQTDSEELPKILIVDDFEPTRFLLRAYLQDEGYQLDFASNGEEALQRAGERSYDLILMDVEMPGINGYEAASRIRSWETSQGRPPVPIVALSAHIKAELDSTGAAVWTSYLNKPVSKVQLTEEVRRYVGAEVAGSGVLSGKKG